jgi:hypothetical protein
LHQSILKKLSAYRSRIRHCVAAEGLSHVVAALVGLIFLSLFIDYFQRLGRPARVLGLVVGLGVLGHLLYRFVLARLRRPMDDERIAQTVEDRFPELGDRVISALQFAQRLQSGETGRGGESLAMMSAVSSDAVAAIEPLDLNRTIDYSRVFKAMLLGTLCALGVVLMSFREVQGVNVMNRWFQRNVLLQNIPWPQRTHLRVDYKPVLPRGDAMAVSVTASGEIPERVYIGYRYIETGRRGEENLARTGQLSENRFETRFRNVVEPLEFKVYGGDAQSEWLRTDLVERPTIMQLKFWLVYPHYTRRDPKAMQLTESFLEVLPGTVIRVAAVPNKALQAAWLEASDEQGRTAMTKITDKRERNFWFSDAEQAELKQKVEQGGYVDEIWTTSLRVDTNKSVALMTRDTVDLVSRPPTRFTVRIEPDREPTVTCRLKGIGEMICSNATLPMAIRIADDFGIKEARLVHKFLLGEAVIPEETIHFKLPYGDATIEHEHNWDLTGLGLQPGSLFVFRVEAEDFKDIGDPNIGKTEAISLRVVKPEELLADLVRRQVEQRQDFVRNRDRVRDEVKIELDAGVRIVASKGKLETEERARLVAVAQTLLHASQEIRHVADVLEQVYQEMVNNKLGDEDERSRLKNGIVIPSSNIALTMIPKLSDAIVAVSKTEGDELKKSLTLVARQTDGLLKEMELVLNNMLRLETMRNIVTSMADLRRAQEDLLTDIEKERLELLKSILGD